jgi:hypothetical protein
VLEDLLIDAGDLGDAVVNRIPFDAECLGQVLAQGRLVKEAGRAGVGVERTAVEGGRAAFGDGAVGDDRVGMELGVAGA